MLTLRQISEQYGISKSTARRRVLECFENLSIEQGKTLQLDSEQAAIFADWMKKRGEVHESALNNSEQVEQVAAETVDTTVDTSNNANTFTAAQVQKLVQEAVQAEKVKQVEQENESLREQVEQYKSRVESLEAEIERLHSALEREQNLAAIKRQGFFARLSQKLLGSGSSSSA